MPTVSGLTTFGIIRKRMADLYLDFATRIKENGVFGTQTTADLPDVFPGDPLVQIMATTSASTSEVWEAVEYFFAQLDRNTASGIALDNLHGPLVGIQRGLNQTDESYKDAINTAQARPTRNHIEAIASARPDVDCALLIHSTADAPIEGIPVPGSALVVKGCNVDYDALAADIFQFIELGSHQLHGEQEGRVSPTPNSCIAYRFVKAEPLFLAMNITGYLTDACGSASTTTVKAAVVSLLNQRYDACGLGGLASEAVIRSVLGSIPGFIVTGIRLGRRARQLWPTDCLPSVNAPVVTVCGVVTPWVGSSVCGSRRAETWCDPVDLCVTVNPWEFIAIDEQFITVTEDLTQGC